MNLKLILIEFAIVFSLSACKKQSFNLFDDQHPGELIAFQPLDGYLEQDLAAISQEISRFYGRKIVVLKPVHIPASFFNPTVNAYSADSIIDLLLRLRNDKVAEVIGLTHHPIYTVKSLRNFSYCDDKIFGMGYWPGRACVISDIRLTTHDTALLNHRMRNVIIHEVGHNAGLDHCSNSECIMSKKSGSIVTLDKGPDDYCPACRRRINW